LNYNNPLTATPLYNGNISETFWKTINDNVLRKYTYSYDELNRLLSANYKRPIGVSGTSPVDSYGETISYDKNGNIKSLIRNGDSDSDDGYYNEIDNLTYTYENNTNKLLKVFDSTGYSQGFNDDSDAITDPDDDYTYDANGNMIADENKSIYYITYNHLNLPLTISFGMMGNIKYIYNALGQKVGKKFTSNGMYDESVDIATDYLSGFQYENEVLQFFPHAEGYVKFKNDEFSYVFNYTDHLGNVRLSYSDIDKDGTLGNEYHQECVVVKPGKPPVCTDYYSSPILEENNYYPFGLKHTGYNDGEPQNGFKYKYNGKELQDELGLNMYDYGWRNYDPALGRWLNINPLT